MLNPNAAEWTPTAFGTGTKGSTFISSAKSAAACPASQLTIQASSSMQIDSEAGVATPNGLAELASVLSGAVSADMTFEDLMFDNSSRRGSVSSLNAFLDASYVYSHVYVAPTYPLYPPRSKQLCQQLNRLGWL
jgi:hypothetical protein